jgi:hypothetical protein
MKRLISLLLTKLGDGLVFRGPFHRPLTPEFLTAVNALNTKIVAGETSVADFTDYVVLLVNKFQASSN